MEREMNAARSLGSESFGSRLPLLATFLAFLLIFSFAVLILSALLGLQLGSAALRPNLFADFQAVWPGQSVYSLAEFAQHTPEGALLCWSGAAPDEPVPGLTVHVSHDPNYIGDRIACTYAPTEGVFRSVSVRVEHGLVQEVTLFSDVLQQDSLLLYWGAPDAIHSIGSPQRQYMRWYHDTYLAEAAVLEGDYMVNIVTLIRDQAPG